MNGAQVIGLNIANSETGGDFNKDLKGDGIENGIFGFC